MARYRLFQWNADYTARNYLKCVLWTSLRVKWSKVPEGVWTGTLDEVERVRKWSGLRLELEPV
jgi:hypothetical protein